MAVKNIVLAVTLVFGCTSFALAGEKAKSTTGGIHRTSQVALQQRPTGAVRAYRRPYAAARMYRGANGPLISAPVGLGLYPGYPADGVYPASQGIPVYQSLEGYTIYGPEQFPELYEPTRDSSEF